MKNNKRINYSNTDITIEDVEKFWDDNKMDFPVKVTDLGNGMVEIKTKNAWGIIPKKQYNEALMKAAESPL